MSLFLKLDQHIWAMDDFTDSATYDLSGKVYRDASFSTPETALDTFTATFRLLDIEGICVFENNTDITLINDGTFTIKFDSGKAPGVYGSYQARLQLEKSGSRVTAIGVNGSDRLFIEFN